MVQQDATELFESGKLPDALEPFANPKPKLTRQDIPAHDRAITVGVIDNGVDYLHPDLAKRIRYDYAADGTIVGAGKDVMGADSWAHPNVIDPELFAFGGELSSDGRIARLQTDPIALLDQLNQDFMSELMVRLLSDSTMSATIFAKMNSKAFHLLGGYRMVLGKKSHLETFEHYQQLGFLLGADRGSWTRLPEVIRDQVKHVAPGTWRRLYDENWVLGSSSGLPEVFASYAAQIEMFEGFDRFLAHVEAAFAAFDSRTEFTKKAFKTYADYRFSLMSREDQQGSADDRLSDFAGDLYDQWFVIHSGFAESDPALAFSQSFCDSLEDSEYKWLRDPLTSAADKAKFLETRVAETFSLASELNQFSLGSGLLSDTQTYDTQQRMQSDPKFHSWYQLALNDRGLEQLMCDDSAFQRSYKYSDVYRNYAERTAHPYFFSGSSTISHGSHVSGIILAQEDQAQVLPVRVVTSSLKTSQVMDTKIRTRFLAEFEVWLKEPVVRAAVLDLLKRNTGFEPPAGLTPDQVDRKVFEKLTEPFALMFESEKLDIYFFEQVRQALEYVAEQKVKVVNISLGAEFEKVTTRIVTDQMTALQDILKFLMFEHFKYAAGRIVTEKAKNTLFVIAAGNSGAWLDGKSRSGLPCDLSSPFLAGSAKKRGVELPPNNRVKNILCVGSIDREDQLSAFTNILLTQVPFVVSYGESILSAVRREDCQGVDQWVTKNLGQDTPTSAFLLSQAVLDRWLERNGSNADSDAEALERTKFSRNQSALSGLHKVAKRHACVSGGYKAYARMSGTSMASPSVAGRMARYAVQKMEALSLTEDQAYDRDEFKPELLIREVADLSPAFGGTSLLRELKKINDIRFYEEADVVDLKLTGQNGRSLMLVP